MRLSGYCGLLPAFVETAASNTYNPKWNALMPWWDCPHAFQSDAIAGPVPRLVSWDCSLMHTHGAGVNPQGAWSLPGAGWLGITA